MVRWFCVIGSDQANKRNQCLWQRISHSSSFLYTSTNAGQVSKMNIRNHIRYTINSFKGLALFHLINHSLRRYIQETTLKNICTKRSWSFFYNISKEHLVCSHFSDPKPRFISFINTFNQALPRAMKGLIPTLRWMARDKRPRRSSKT